MTSLYVLLAAALLGQNPPSQPAKVETELTDPKAIVQRSVEALAKVEVVSYDLLYIPTGWITAFFPAVSGPVIVGKDTPDKAQRFHCKLTVKPSNSEEVREVTAGADGNDFYLIDPKTRTVHADMDQGVFGKEVWVIMFAVMREYAIPNPFEDSLKAGTFKLEESKSVDGVDCYAVRIKPPSEPEAVWYFGKKDFLPRRATYEADNGKGEVGTTDMTLTKLTVNPKFVRNPFELIVPEGFKKTDEFAP